MHSTEAHACDSSMFHRKKRITQTIKLAACSGQPLGRLPVTCQLPQLAGIDTHISAALNVPARSTIGDPDRGKRGSKMDLARKTQVIGSVADTRELGITLIVKNGTVRSNGVLFLPSGWMLSLTEISAMAKHCLSTFYSANTIRFFLVYFPIYRTRLKLLPHRNFITE